MATLKVLIESVDSDTLVQALVDRQQPASARDMHNFLISYLQEIKNGRKVGSVLRFSAVDTQATGTATLASVIADDTITLGSRVLTAKVSPANQNQFTLGADDTETAANLVTVINANTDLKNWLKATSSAEVVTLTCLVSGLIGNNIPLAASATITLSDVTLTSGADANNVTETV